MQEPLYWDWEFDCILYSVWCKLFGCSGCHWQRGEVSLTSFNIVGGIHLLEDIFAMFIKTNRVFHEDDNLRRWDVKGGLHEWLILGRKSVMFEVSLWTHLSASSVSWNYGVELAAPLLLDACHLDLWKPERHSKRSNLICFSYQLFEKLVLFYLWIIIADLLVVLKSTIWIATVLKLYMNCRLVHRTHINRISSNIFHYTITV